MRWQNYSSGLEICGKLKTNFNIIPNLKRSRLGSVAESVFYFYTECKKIRIQTLRICRGDKTKPFCYVTNIWQVHCFLARGPWRVWRRMVLQKLLKMSSVYINAQLVSTSKWLCLTNNCCSFCHTGNQLFCSVYRCLVQLTLHLPPDKEIHRSEIGRTWWPLYWTTPPHPTIGKNIVQVFSDIKGKVCWGPVMLEP